MAGTRRSTRQTTSTAAKYNEDSSPSAGEEAPKRNGAKPTRRKRAREDDDEQKHVGDQGQPPPKKATKSKSKSTPSKSTATSTKPSPPTAPSSTNRNPDGSQQTYWLLKAEPLPRYENGINVSFSIDDLAACTRPEPWSGVRNPQARNNMQAMRAGDLGFFYHSNAKPSGVVGILRVVEEAKVDETAFDTKDPYYDPKSRREEPKWYCVGVEFVKKFGECVDLKRIKGCKELAGMQLVTNSRLSVSRVRREEWDFILGLAGETDKIGEESKEGGLQDIK